jgi:uncharacterized DUF497 family protein/predicted DNA binding CopG/RHH family protein
MIDLDQFTGFDWDDGNSRKSADKHDVSQAEAESIFFNDPLIVVVDARHSEAEQRFNALGKTAQNRLLDITFTLRQNGTKIRVISARDMHRMRGRLMSKLKPIPAFKSEAEERKFWETHDSTDYIDWSKAERMRFPNLKPSTTAISMRLPLGLLEQIKIAANKRDVPYQSLIKMWLAEKVG